MPLPTPEPGLVVNFRFLWKHEHAAGAEEGRKDRPCAVILAVTSVRGVMEVVVAPMTHTKPVAPSEGIPVPPAVKRHLGLDDAQSWIIVTDLNVFTWPGYDLRPRPNTDPPRYDYGKIPPRLYEAVRARVAALISLGKATDRGG